MYFFFFILWIKAKWHLLLCVSVLIQSAFMQWSNLGLVRMTFLPQASYTSLCSHRTYRLQFPLFQESHRGGVWRALESAEESEASEPEEVEQTDRAKRDSGASSLKSIESRPACYSDSSVKDSHRLCLSSESLSGPLTALQQSKRAIQTDLCIKYLARLA